MLATLATLCSNTIMVVIMDTVVMETMGKMMMKMAMMGAGMVVVTHVGMGVSEVMAVTAIKTTVMKMVVVMGTSAVDVAVAMKMKGKMMMAKLMGKTVMAVTMGTCVGVSVKSVVEAGGLAGAMDPYA
jgi:hypothetical protein